MPEAGGCVPGAADPGPCRGRPSGPGMRRWNGGRARISTIMNAPHAPRPDPDAGVPPASIAWSDAFLLGYPPMDDTHREFVDCLRALQAATDAELPECLAAMRAHAVSHFEQEKRWMEETDFPAAQCHIDEHTAVLGTLDGITARLRDAGDTAVVRNIAQALADWFPGHADYMDAALSHWMCKRQYGGKPVVLRRGVASR